MENISLGRWSKVRSRTTARPPSSRLATPRRVQLRLKCNVEGESRLETVAGLGVVKGQVRVRLRWFSAIESLRGKPAPGGQVEDGET